MLDVKITADGQKNVTLLLKGVLTEELELTPVLLTDQLQGSPKRMKLTDALWMIQEKMGIILWWSERQLVLLMESRNSVRLDRGWDSPGDWDGALLISSFNQTTWGEGKHFVIELGFDKQ